MSDGLGRVPARVPMLRTKETEMTKTELPPLPQKKPAVFHHPFGLELYDGMAMDLHAMAYAEVCAAICEDNAPAAPSYFEIAERLRECAAEIRRA